MAFHCHVILWLLFLLPAMSPPPAAAAWEQQRQTSPPPEANPTLDIHPSAAMMAGLIAAVFFFIGVYSVYIVYCSRSITAAGIGSSRGGRWKRARRPGLDLDVIEMFPMLVYSDVKGLMLGKGALECVVCLNEFEDYETLRWIPKCDHVFHPDCIDEWLEYHTTCPVCRAELTPQPNEPAYTVPVFTVQHDDLAIQVVVQETPDPNSDMESGRDVVADQQEPVDANKTPNQSYRRSEAGSFKPLRFSRSHSTGHSLIQPGQDTERFTLRLPVDVRKLVIDRAADIARAGSSRKGKRTSTDEGSSRGLRYLRRIERPFKSDRWVFPRMASLLTRAWMPGNRDDEGSIGRLGRAKEAQMVPPANPGV